MAQGKELTCDDYKEFFERSDALWQEWVFKANTNDPQEWDAAFVSYTQQMEDLRQAFGHPAGRPRKRP